VATKWPFDPDVLFLLLSGLLQTRELGESIRIAGRLLVMTDECWATFSTIDHRSPLYRRALVLFDRIVVPIPPQPVGDQTEQELEQLAAEVAFLEKHDAAVGARWNSQRFQEWRRPFLAEAVASKVNRDIFHDSRLMLSEMAELLKPPGVEDVDAVPVYAGAENFQQAAGLMTVQEALNLEIMHRLPVPASDTPLTSLVELREKESFRASLRKLRHWQRKVLPEIEAEQKKPRAIRKAMSDFDDAIAKYSEAIHEANFKKVEVGVCTILVVGTALAGLPQISLTVLAGVAPKLFSLRELTRPSWKRVAEKDCAIAGVVYDVQKCLP
jgi:hypothetical protein